MDNEWPEFVIDEDDAILDEEIVLSGTELEQAEREACAALSKAAHLAAAALGNLVGAFQGFRDLLRVIHDDAVLSETEVDAEYIEE